MASYNRKNHITNLLIIIILCSIQTNVVSANNIIEKGKKFIIEKDYESASQYFKNINTGYLSNEVNNIIRSYISYLDILLYAKNYLLEYHSDSHIIVHFHQDLINVNEIKILSQKCEKYYLNINKKLSLDYNDFIHVYLYPESMEIDLWKNIKYLSLYNLTEGEIHIHYGGLNNHGHIEHEMTHIMSAHLNSFNYNKKLNAILIEGLAEYVVEKPWGIDLDYWVKGFLDIQLFIPLSNLLSGQDFRSYNQIITYEESGSFVKHLIETNGLKKFKLLYSNPSYKYVYGKTFQCIENEWINKIKQIKVTNKDLELIKLRLKIGNLYRYPDKLRQIPWIGITTESKNNSIWIKKVSKNSPASEADLKKGDEIISIDEVLINENWKILALLLDKKPGYAMTFKFKRNKKILTSSIILRFNSKWKEVL